jgi:hypothetical protein
MQRYEKVRLEQKIFYLFLSSDFNDPTLSICDDNRGVIARGEGVVEFGTFEKILFIPFV